MHKFNIMFHSTFKYIIVIFEKWINSILFNGFSYIRNSVQFSTLRNFSPLQFVWHGEDEWWHIRRFNNGNMYFFLYCTDFISNDSISLYTEKGKSFSYMWQIWLDAFKLGASVDIT